MKQALSFVSGLTPSVVVLESGSLRATDNATSFARHPQNVYEGPQITVPYDRLLPIRWDTVTSVHTSPKSLIVKHQYGRIQIPLLEEPMIWSWDDKEIAEMGEDAFNAMMLAGEITSMDNPRVQLTGIYVTATAAYSSDKIGSKLRCVAFPEPLEVPEDFYVAVPKIVLMQMSKGKVTRASLGRSKIWGISDDGGEMMSSTLDVEPVIPVVWQRSFAALRGTGTVVTPPEELTYLVNTAAAYGNDRFTVSFDGDMMFFVSKDKNVQAELDVEISGDNIEHATTLSCSLWERSALKMEFYPLGSDGKPTPVIITHDETWAEQTVILPLVGGD